MSDEQLIAPPTHSYGGTITTAQNCCGESYIQHDCTMKAIADLRFRSIFLSFEKLEQAYQCIYCGKIDWRPVPTVCEEDNK